MKKLSMILLLCGFIAVNARAVTLDALQQRFAGQPVVRAHFDQQRRIGGIARPLRSSGELLVARQNGLWWQQQQPFLLTLILNDSRMVQITGNQAPEVITAASNPQMFRFNHLLRALFQADRAVLEQNFTLQFTDQGQDNWQLVLVPKTSPLDKLFTSITLTGRTYLDHILLEDKQGDSTAITFSQQRTQPDVLSHDEQQRFVQ
ncbi:LolA family protein [Acerihabitans arboris]|uniref:Outer membrane lipoprotein carrier protein LolA n=1 Tax=Acerihabitans arboris TaxID=2691583 RepID=A0A845SRR0_9GAMM|nr:outer membrane lipoprotein carrier protein LolA [Acerihabitans arboris]NDL65624.1 outer membrane lipoprotein carrier protein LolA [Acerihabitans arboris]